MIINEQHDLDKTKENVYILQKGLLFSFFGAQIKFHDYLGTLALVINYAKQPQWYTSCAKYNGPKYQV